ncbi:MAG: diacylglycerol kinase [Nitrospiraceae bacterium]|nr:diacylglycerol kinase [Nitrospiraceae bacterium]
MSSLDDWLKSAGFAIEGILHAAKTQRHLRYHFYAAFFVLFLSFVVGVARTEFLVISASVILVLLAEMLNTAIEATVDIICPGPNEKARIAKDIAAGAVLVTSFGVAVLGIIILYPYMGELFESGFRIAKHSRQDIAILAVVFVLIAVVLLKARFGRGRPLAGGMPSGHAALAFSVWVSITYLTGNFLASALAFVLAFAVARGRVKKKIHEPFEVIAGGALGSALTFIFFKLFS